MVTTASEIAVSVYLYVGFVAQLCCYLFRSLYGARNMNPAKNPTYATSETVTSTVSCTSISIFCNLK